MLRHLHQHAVTVCYCLYIGTRNYFELRYNMRQACRFVFHCLKLDTYLYVSYHEAIIKNRAATLTTAATYLYIVKVVLCEGSLRK